MPSNLSRAKLLQCNSPALLQCFQRAKFFFISGGWREGQEEGLWRQTVWEFAIQNTQLALCLVKGKPAAPATEQSTVSPSIGQEVHSLKGTLNPEEARDRTPSTSAVCPNLPVSPRSQSANLRPSGLVPWGTVEGRVAWLAPDSFSQKSSPVRWPGFPTLSPCC